MPIPPPPYKLKCPKCGHSKIVKLSSDALSAKDILAMSTTCPKCGESMERVEMGVLDGVRGLFG